MGRILLVHGRLPLTLVSSSGTWAKFRMENTYGLQQRSWRRPAALAARARGVRRLVHSTDPLSADPCSVQLHCEAAVHVLPEWPDLVECAEIMPSTTTAAVA